MPCKLCRFAHACHALSKEPTKETENTKSEFDKVFEHASDYESRKEGALWVLKYLENKAYFTDEAEPVAVVDLSVIQQEIKAVESK